MLLPGVAFVFAMVAMVACWFRHRIPLLFSPNPFINSLAWVVLIGGQFVLLDQIHYRNTSMFAWVGMFVLAYAISVVVQQILGQKDDSATGSSAGST